MYTQDEIIKATKIYSYLMENKELDIESNREYYANYNDEKIMELVKAMAESTNCEIDRYAGTIYLMPNSDNDFLGYSSKELKKELCKSNAKNSDYYLALFVVLILIREFYSAQGITAKSKKSMTFADLFNSISEKLLEIEECTDIEDLEDSYDYSFTAINVSWNALTGSDNAKKTSKIGFITNILKFLEKQGLVNFIEADDLIFTTKRLDDLMNWKMLRKANYENILRALDFIEKDV